MTLPIKGICFGEVLWDLFPDKKKIGGAPLNVALRMQSLGCKMSIISAVGNDSNGKSLISFLNKNGIDTKNIQLKNDFPTGKVTVTLNNENNASYSIDYPAAWDKIDSCRESEAAIENTDVIVFGSLICRDKVSRQTLLNILKTAPYKVFDVNLRQPHYNFETLTTLMQQADFIKLNDNELLELSGHLGSNEKDIRKNILFISEKSNTNSVCVTRGPEGAVLYWDGKFYSHPGYTVSVVDTVGAGDSFLGALITGLMQKTAPHTALDHACAIGALVASKEGANPNVKDPEIRALMATKK
ncbi:carbohydrate kinase [Zhouia spongiae]|uniref:Carbohydrate kinase n=1 Tax=Zhouia spongiae TaxID=2202721 RepID=A0ABY3YQ18_9FLAO|nr:carbohydrate kinase [Zhouia spongiae]UNY99937.1 carbohydrate kinase [Zhouia spongiae]